MAQIYCKAYTMNDVRRFTGWTEKQPGHERAQWLQDDAICYIWDDLTVVSSPVAGEEDNILFDDITPEWQRFCVEELDFKIPDDIEI